MRLIKKSRSLLFLIATMPDCIIADPNRSKPMEPCPGPATPTYQYWQTYTDACSRLYKEIQNGNGSRPCLATATGHYWTDWVDAGNGTYIDEYMPYTFAIEGGIACEKNVSISWVECNRQFGRLVGYEYNEQARDNGELCQGLQGPFTQDGELVSHYKYYYEGNLYRVTPGKPEYNDWRTRVAQDLQYPENVYENKGYQNLTFWTTDTLIGY
jgi:hypothetical protein